MIARPLAWPPEESVARRLRGAPLLALLDVDGTLAPIASRPELAAVPAATRDAIAALVARPQTHVALVSGRSAADARRLVGVDGVWALGNHGMERVTPDGREEVDDRIAPWARAVAEAAATLRATLGGIAGVIVEDKRWTLSVHYRLAAVARVPGVERTVVETSRALGLAVTRGKEVLEIRPPVEVHKGTATRELAERLGATGAGASLLFAGDDLTDEDAFRLLRSAQPSAVTVHVGGVTLADGSLTCAELLVPDPTDVRRLLDWLATVS